MPDLQACYFCGAVDDLTRVAVVPPRFDPTPDEQRRVVLCPTCRTKLAETIRPLADRLDRAAAGGHPAESTGGTPSGAGSEDADADATDEARGPDRAAAPDEAPSRTGGADADDGGITFGPSTDDADADATDAEREDVDRAGSGPPAEDADPSARDAGGNGGPSPSPSAASGATGAAPGRDTPAGYRQVLRLLSNRDLPMARDAVEALASSAYDVDRRQVAAVLDAAVERGDLVEERGQLRQP
jgi:hypothetical protein